MDETIEVTNEEWKELPMPPEDPIEDGIIVPEGSDK